MGKKINKNKQLLAAITIWIPLAVMLLVIMSMGYLLFNKIKESGTLYTIWTDISILTLISPFLFIQFFILAIGIICIYFLNNIYKKIIRFLKNSSIITGKINLFILSVFRIAKYPFELFDTLTSLIKIRSQKGK